MLDRMVTVFLRTRESARHAQNRRENGDPWLRSEREESPNSTEQCAG